MEHSCAGPFNRNSCVGRQAPPRPTSPSLVLASANSEGGSPIAGRACAPTNVYPRPPCTTPCSPITHLRSSTPAHDLPAPLHTWRTLLAPPHTYPQPTCTPPHGPACNPSGPPPGPPPGGPLHTRLQPTWSAPWFTPWWAPPHPPATHLVHHPLLQVRLLVASADLEVLSLKRVRIGGYRIPRTLGFGQFVPLTATALKRITWVGGWGREGEAACTPPGCCGVLRCAACAVVQLRCVCSSLRPLPRRPLRHAPHSHPRRSLREQEDASQQDRQQLVVRQQRQKQETADEMLARAQRQVRRR